MQGHLTLEDSKTWMKRAGITFLDTNLNGAYQSGKEILPTLYFWQRIKPGSIVNIASILGLRVGLNLASYATAKAGLSAAHQKHGLRACTIKHQS